MTTPVWSDGACKNCRDATNQEDPFWFSAENRCVTKCPDEAPRVDGNGVCQKCPSETPFWDRNLDRCVVRCQQVYDANGICISCAEKNVNHPYWYTEIQACAPCPDDIPYWNGQACVRCADVDQTRPVWNGQNCVACPSETPQWDPSLEKCRTCADINLALPYWEDGCRACPPAREFYDRDAGECVQECPGTVPLPNEINVCLTCKEVHTVMTIWDPMTESCVEKCKTAIHNNGELIC